MAKAWFGPESALSPSASFAVRGQQLESPLGRKYLADESGTYNQSPLLARAMAELEQDGGGDLEVLPNAAGYLFTDPIPPRTNVTLRGHGVAGRLILGRETINIFDGPDAVSNFGLENLYFDGSQVGAVTDANGPGMGFNLGTVDGLTLRRLWAYRMPHRLGMASAASDVTVETIRMIEHAPQGDPLLNIGPQGLYLPNVQGLYLRDFYSRECRHSRYQPFRVTALNSASLLAPGREIMIDGVRTIRCGFITDLFNGGGSGFTVASTSTVAGHIQKITISNLLFEACADTHCWIVGDIVVIQNVVDRGSTLGGPLELQGRAVLVSNFVSDNPRGYAIWYHTSALTGAYFLDCDQFKAHNIVVNDGHDAAIGLFNDSWAPFSTTLAFNTNNGDWPVITVADVGVGAAGISAGSPLKIGSNPTEYLVTAVDAAAKRLTLSGGADPVVAAGGAVLRRGARLGDIDLGAISVNGSRGPAVEISHPTGPVRVDGAYLKNTNKAVLALATLTADSSSASGQITVDSTANMQVRDYMWFGVDVDNPVTGWTATVTGVGAGETRLRVADNLGATGIGPKFWDVGNVIQIAGEADTTVASVVVLSDGKYAVVLAAALAIDHADGAVITNATRGNTATLSGLATGGTKVTVNDGTKVRLDSVVWVGSNEFAGDAEEVVVGAVAGTRVTVGALTLPHVAGGFLIRARQFGIYSIDGPTTLTLSRRFSTPAAGPGYFPAGTTFYNPFTAGHAALDIYGDTTLNPGVVDLRGVITEDDQAVPTTQRGIYLDKINGLVRVDAVIGATATSLFHTTGGVPDAPTAGPLPLTANTTPGLLVSTSSRLGSGSAVGMTGADPTTASVRDLGYDVAAAPSTTLAVGALVGDTSITVVDGTKIPQGSTFWLGTHNNAIVSPGVWDSEILYANTVVGNVIGLLPALPVKYPHGIGDDVRLTAAPGALEVVGPTWDGAHGGRLKVIYEKLAGAWKLRLFRSKKQVPPADFIIENESGFVQINPGNRAVDPPAAVLGWRFDATGFFPVPSSAIPDVGLAGNPVRNTYYNATSPTAGAPVLYVKAGIPVDGDFAAVRNGMVCIDSTNGRMYCRYGGAWHYATLT